MFGLPAVSWRRRTIRLRRAMADHQSLESLFVENLPLIDRVAAAMARRNGLSGEEIADFSSWTKLKLIEDEYAVLKKFRGESSIGTYLTVVIAMLARDYRVQRLGRWRPSAAARRLGRVAVRLEVLVRRQGLHLQQAGETLRTAGETSLSDRDLAALLAKLPERGAMRPVPVGAERLMTVESDAQADSLIAGESQREERRLIEDTLRRAMSTMSVEDRLVLRLRYWEGSSVAEIARALGLEQKPLYRRIDRLLAQLRRELAVSGVGHEVISQLLDNAVA